MVGQSIAMSTGVEPASTAKVILHTTKGPVEIEVWAKEIPLASRNFIQHCLNGYYDGTIFHRIVPNFIIQGGDPSGSGYGGESVYDGGVFKDEFHSRIKFTHRGMVGCANTGEKNSNGSQFMITLTATPELDRKNTCFGRVVGDTLYNVLRISEGEIEKDERPLYPTKIERTEVVVPYFDDLDYSRLTANSSTKDQDVAALKKKKKKRPVVSMNFDDEEGPAIIPKIKKKTEGEPPVQRKPSIDKAGELSEPANHQTGTPEDTNRPVIDNVKPADQLENEFEKLKASMKKKNAPKKVETVTQMTPLEQEQASYQRNKKKLSTMSDKDKAAREAKVLAMLEKFQAKLTANSVSTHSVSSTPKDTQGPRELASDEELPSDYEEEEPYDDDWMSHRFEYEDDNRMENRDLLVTIDPLQQKRKQEQIYKQADPMGQLKKRRKS